MPPLVSSRLPPTPTPRPFPLSSRFLLTFSLLPYATNGPSERHVPRYTVSALGFLPVHSLNYRLSPPTFGVKVTFILSQLEI